jgi:hypothetical protein
MWFDGRFRKPRENSPSSFRNSYKSRPHSSELLVRLQFRFLVETKSSPSTFDYTLTSSHHEAHPDVAWPGHVPPRQVSFGSAPEVRILAKKA